MANNTGPSTPTVNTKVNITSTADIIAAVAGQRVYVYSGMLVSAGAETLDIQDGSTSLTGVMTLATGTPFFLHPNPDGTPIFETSVGNALHAVKGASVQLSGYLRTYQG